MQEQQKRDRASLFDRWDQARALMAATLPASVLEAAPLPEPLCYSDRVSGDARMTVGVVAGYLRWVATL